MTLTVFQGVASARSLFRDLIDVFGGTQSILTFASNHGLFALGLCLSVATLLLERLSARKDFEKWDEIALLNTPIGQKTLNRLAKNVTIEGGAALTIYGNEAGWSDPNLNATLARASIQGQDIDLEVLDAPWFAYDPADKATSSLKNRKKQYSLARKIRKGARLTNDSKIRLSSDITGILGSSVAVQKTDYLSSLMTDQLAFRRIVARTDNDDLLHDGLQDFIMQDRGKDILKSLSQANTVSNQMGASTLGFTRDGVLVLVRQSNKNAQSVGRLAPSGSGSLDWSDIAETQQPWQLLKLVRHGAARELYEECGLADVVSLKDLRERLNVYAFSRMIHRAGKPEFFCVAGIPFLAAEINNFQTAREEVPFTEKTVSANMPKINWEGDLVPQMRHICRYYSDESNYQNFNQDTQALSLSYPLRHGLDLLADLCDHSPDVAKDLCETIKTSAFNRLQILT